jgi:uncharacterized protein DUF6456
MSQSQSKRASRKQGARRDIGGIPDIDIAESPIGWLYCRRDKDGEPLISRAEFEAGERLRRDFSFAQLMPRVTSSWADPAGSRSAGRGAPGAGSDIQDNVIAAGERVGRALKAVGPELSGILIDVCCHLKGLEMKERQAGWPQRSGKIVLRIALKSLARHYGLIRDGDEEGTAGTARVRHWGGDGYRPDIDGAASSEA